MSAYTRRLGAFLVEPPGLWKVVYDHPGNVQVVIRDIVLSTTSTAAGAVYVAIFPRVRTGQVTLIVHPSLAAGTHHHELRQVLEPAEYLAVFAATSGVYCAVTGYVLKD